MENSEIKSMFEHVEMKEWDPIIEILEEYRCCTDPNKINLTVGAYRDENLQPVVFKSVREAEEKIIASKFSRAYLPPTGDEEFNRISQSTLFDADHPVIKENRIVTVQSLSGSGCLRLGGEFTCKFINRNILIPHLTWPNHNVIFERSKFSIQLYRYYDDQTNLLDLKGLIEDLANAPENSIVLLHVCGHNPTGVDPSKEDWNEILRIMKKKNLFPFFDLAYEGFVSGDLKEDAYPIHLFLENGFEMVIAVSFSKSMGLYGERAGPLHVIANDPSCIENIRSQLAEIALGLYLVPVGHGSRIVKEVLKDERLRSKWEEELKAAADRLNYARNRLYEELVRLMVPGSWEHIRKQKGMFSYTGLNVEQCEALIAKHKIFLVKTGRISLAGINAQNVQRVAMAIKEVVETVKVD